MDSQESIFTLPRRDGECIGEAVVTAVADAKGVSPLNLDPPLATVIDPDALDTVVTSMASLPEEPTANITFPYNGYEVTVTEDGGVTTTMLELGDE